MKWGLPDYEFWATMNHVVVDLETGGLNSARCGITQVSAVVFREAFDKRRIEVLDQLHLAVEPEQGLVYESQALELSGYEDVCKSLPVVPMDEALRQLYNLSVTFHAYPINRVMWAHKSEFDFGFLQKACERTGMPMAFTSHRCTLQMFRKWFPGKPASMAKALEAVGVDVSQFDFHKAQDDAMGCAFLLRELIRLESNKTTRIRMSMERRARLECMARLGAQL